MDTFVAVTDDNEYVLVLALNPEGMTALLDDGTTTVLNESLKVGEDREARYRLSLYNHLLSTIKNKRSVNEYYARSLALRAKHLAALRPCDTCLEAKPLDHFYKRSREADGIDNICKACRTEANALSYMKRAGKP